jgi:hypothetical protein
MLRFLSSHRPLQLFSSPPSTLTPSCARGIRTTVILKRLRDRVNSPGIGTSQFILKHKDNARRVKTNRFLLSIDKLLRDGERKKAWDSLYRKMELPSMADSQTRFNTYEHAITLFSSYERFEEAVEIQRSMIDEGFIPSLSLRTRMASVAVLNKGAEEEVLLELLQGPMSDPNFTELALYQLIRFLGDTMDFSPSNLDAIVQSWAKLHGQISQKTLSYLIQIHVKRGQLEDAKARLQHSIDHGTTLDAAPFTDLITGFVRREHTDELTATIAQMQKAGVAPDLAVFNTIIFGHIKRLHFLDALSTYNLLFSSRGDKLTPDKYTFTNMFTMHLKRLRPEFQVYSVKRARLPPPRKLYNNLMECHFIRTGGQHAVQSNVLTTNVLNLALRLFLRTKDYEAAYLVFHTFRICQVPANATTVRIVLQPLLAKIRKERRTVAKKNTWVRTLLGSVWYENVEANGNWLSLTEIDILERLWIVGTAGIHLDSEPKYSDLNWRVNAAVRDILSGKTEKLALTDLNALKNIVRRMFIAGAHSMDLDPSIPTPVVWTKRLAKAKKSMIPDKGPMKTYFATGKAGDRLKKLVREGGDKRKRHDLRYYPGG